jgi:hypothetical protein
VTEAIVAAAELECNRTGMDVNLTARVTEITEGSKHDEAVNGVLFVGAGPQGHIVQRGCKREQQENAARHSHTQSCCKAYFHVLAHKDAHGAEWNEQEAKVKTIIKYHFEAWLANRRKRATELASGAGTSGAGVSAQPSTAGQMSAPVDESQNRAAGFSLYAREHLPQAGRQTLSPVPEGVEQHGSCPVATGLPLAGLELGEDIGIGTKIDATLQHKRASGTGALPAASAKRRKAGACADDAVPETDDEGDD